MCGTSIAVLMTVWPSGLGRTRPLLSWPSGGFKLWRALGQRNEIETPYACYVVYISLLMIAVHAWCIQMFIMNEHLHKGRD